MRWYLTMGALALVRVLGHIPNRIAMVHAILLLFCCAFLLLGLSACAGGALTRESTPTSEVVATAFTAAISIELVIEGSWTGLPCSAPGF